MKSKYASRELRPLEEVGLISEEFLNIITAQIPSTYTHPSTHPATMIAEDTAHNFVSQTEKSNIHTPGSDNQDLSGLQPKESGKGLSTNDYTNIEKEKLSGVPKITLSDTEPSNPQEGDLWIDTGE